MVGECLSFITNETGLIASLFLAGLFGGITHCSAMCGPFVLAQCSDVPDTKSPTLQRITGSALLPYHLGRMTTYVLLALCVNSFFNVAFASSEFRHIVSGFMLGLAGLIFLVSSVRVLSEIFPWVSRLHLPMIFKIPSLLLSRLSRSHNGAKNYVVGILLGFMPCGLVLAALLATTTAPNIYVAVTSMAAFTVGTMPALWGIAFVGESVRRVHPQFKLYFSNGAMVLSAVMLFILAGKSLS